MIGDFFGSFFKFQSTPSVWRETLLLRCHSPALVKFQSTPSVWRETRATRQKRAALTISIHSLRVEGDRKTFAVDLYRRISIHSLRVEGDATEDAHGSGSGHFNPLPPCGGRHYVTSGRGLMGAISIHSLRVEGDCLRTAIGGKNGKISIHSLRVEGDCRVQRHPHGSPISIHSLRVEGDNICFINVNNL